LYQGFLPLLNSGKVELLDNAVCVAQLANLERKTARGGRDSIDHPSGAYHDDVANSVAGVSALVVSYVQRGPFASVGTFQTFVFDTGDCADGRRYKPGMYGGRIEVILEWVERGERFSPEDQRAEIVTNDIVHDHNSSKQMEKLQ
jgi:hypothetical protein